MPTALITGPTAGIGAAFARALAKEGSDLVLVSRDKARLESMVADLTKLGAPTVEVLPADLSTDEGMTTVELRIKAAPIDLLINNAGFGQSGPFLDAPLKDELDMLRLHVEAILRLSTAALETMVERGSGDVINVASVAAFFARGTYGASKAWVVSFSRGVAGELAGKGVRVMALCPGFVKTEFHDRAGMDMSSLNSRLWLNADFVAAESLKDLRKGLTVSVPSVGYKTLVGLGKFVPTRLASRISSKAGRKWE